MRTAGELLLILPYVFEMRLYRVSIRSFYPFIRAIMLLIKLKLSMKLDMYFEVEMRRNVERKESGSMHAYTG